MSYWNRYVSVEVLQGKTITEIVGMNDGSHKVYFTCSDGSEYKMYHEQDCCECVYLVDVVGDPVDILGEEILEAYSSSKDDPDCCESGTWTFYNIRSRIGGVTLRWHGSSNGYYSEGVSFIDLKEPA